MCGIAGAKGPDLGEARAAVEAMCAQMWARGPDDGGEAAFEPAGLVIGARRLSIIDVSSAGHQPMRDDGRGTTIVFNGMIYNYPSLREELIAAGEEFSSHSDTEVVLRAYGRWGRSCIRRLRGMFGLAIWDERAGELLLARDRLGIKPIYYWRDRERFLFASQVKALLSTGIVPPRLSREGIRSFLDFGAVVDPLTAIEGVHALPAGHLAVLRNGELEVERYWDFPTDAVSIPREEAVEELRERVDDAVRTHLISDAPLGVFLSGGIDSSVVAALAARHTSLLRTVSVVFGESGFSEEEYMRAVVERVGSDHVSIELRPADLLAWSQDAFEAMDQPSFDGVNTYVVSRAASETGLKVALSGLGGDELFDGYGYLRRVRLLERARALPAPVGRAAALAARVALKEARAAKTAEWLTPGRGNGSAYELLRRLFLPHEVERLAGPGGGAPRPQAGRNSDLYRRISILELTNYTRHVLLRDTDAMSMGNSLEVRVPFLDHVLVEWVLRLPAATKAGKNKALLVDSVRDLLPEKVITRRKHGFLLPLKPWMERELRDEIAATLHRPPAPVAELLDQAAIDGVWDGYVGGRQSWHRPWALYALCRWTESLLTGPPPGSVAVQARTA